MQAIEDNLKQLHQEQETPVPMLFYCPTQGTVPNGSRFSWVGTGPGSGFWGWVIGYLF